MSDTSREFRVLRGYVIVSTLFSIVLAISAFAPRQTEELTLERLNIVDKEGKVRVTIAGTFPPSRSAYSGLMFYNNDGKESGGLVYTGTKKDGKVSASSGLTMDQYGNDQTVVLQQDDENGRKQNGLIVIDRPDSTHPRVTEYLRALNKVKLPPGFTAATRDSAIKAVKDSMSITDDMFLARRVFVGRDKDKTAIVNLSDAQGKPRLRLSVDSLGEASIAFLDAKGKVTRTIR